ncbi:MAG: hypothetical protein COW30_13935 [Rhodospirillales bacterium CG15_BIG_FIL_POST_REV_8_21_14_020_66_15]|nr:MAG: hypothetical protein COW30_13935 [Rhodospirillales bacterium CG15_BIG_FIL_POST_REV_8_21_14_020_66_15]
MAHGPEKKSKGSRKKSAKASARKPAAKKARGRSGRSARPATDISTSILGGEAQDLIRDAFLNRP